jgi:hypothetical protein
MFACVKRFFRPLLYVLISAQLLLSAPVVSALTAASASNSMPCAGMMMGDTEPCPCCPEGTESMAQCLSACAAAFGFVVAHSGFASEPASSCASAPLFKPLAVLAEPPIKPPPIR